MKNIFCSLYVVLFLTACASVNAPVKQTSASNHWTLIYANDDKGNSLEGSKEKLIEAIRVGKPVRIYTASSRIEHAFDAQFLSIFEGEIFAQIMPIESQRPTSNPTQILFRNPGEKWRSIVGSNGFVTALLDGQEPNVRTGSTKWFVLN